MPRKNFFFLSEFPFRHIQDSQYSWEGGGYLFNSSLPLPPASQKLAGRLLERAHLELSAAGLEPETFEPLNRVSERKLLTTKVRGPMVRE